MEKNRYELFFILVKLKAYLTSLIDRPDDCLDAFELTEEFFSRRYPDRKEELITLLRENGIRNECQIVFEPMINTKFKEIALKYDNGIDIQTLLDNFEIESKELTEKEKQLSGLIGRREDSIKKIIRRLLILAKQWGIHKEIDLNIDDFSLLDEEELIRIEEKDILRDLDTKSIESFKKIIEFTVGYLELMLNHFFEYRGNIYLKDFLKEIESLKIELNNKYNELYKKSGLDLNGSDVDL